MGMALLVFFTGLFLVAVGGIWGLSAKVLATIAIFTVFSMLLAAIFLGDQ